MKRGEINTLFAGDEWYAEYGKPILTLLLASPIGLNVNSLAKSSEFPRPVVLETLRKLNLIGMVDNRGDSYKEVAMYEPSDNARRSVKDNRFQPKQRLCLSCEQMFFSTHAGNRICNRCKESEEGLGCAA